MAGARRELGTGRRWFIALAALALIIQVLVPQGFMVSADAAGPGLVICTGHGPLLAAPDHAKPGKAPKSASDSPCAFAVHGAGAAPPALVRIEPVRFGAPPALIAPLFDIAPGRGLAAPPPPSHAPPPRLI